MRARALRCLVVAAAVVTAFPTAATENGSATCELPAAGADPLTDRAAILAEYERLPRPCLHAIFSACTTAASQTLLDFGSAAVCSFGYEALLKHHFGGNFRALLAWWRSQRGEALQ